MIAVITTAAGRHEHLLLQRAGIRAGAMQPDLHVVVAMDDPQIATLCDPGVTVVELPGRRDRLPVAAARNAGARRALDAGADVLVFLDVDCVPSPGLIGRYAQAASTVPDTLLSGAVRYLPQAPVGGYRLETLADLGRPHPARPEPSDDEVVPLPYELFWSLSFAVTSSMWSALPGFCERYEGYGAEDTDFAQTARTAGVAHAALGGAVAYHQWHPSSDPPTHHLDDIVRNARIFHERWGWWPMRGWLDAFARLGMVAHDPRTDDWARC